MQSFKDIFYSACVGLFFSGVTLLIFQKFSLGILTQPHQKVVFIVGSAVFAAILRFREAIKE